MKLFGKEFKLFNLAKDGKGVKKEPEGPKNLANFFKHYANKFTRLVCVNLLYIMGNFPIIFLIMGLSGNFDRASTAPAYKMFAPLYGVLTHEKSPVTAALFGIYGAQSEIGFPTVWTYILLGLSALLIFTFGYANTGTTYILRNMVKGEPIFLWDDFWYAIKRNKRQGLIMGILDLLLSVVCVGDIIFFYYNVGINGVANFMYYAAMLITLLWFWMRFYIYNLMITFDLSIFKILKNALIFSLLGFKRNLMATLGIVASLIIMYVVMVYALPIGMLMPFVILISTGSFMACYAAFPKIKEHMIDPYYKDEKKEDDEPVFHDMG